MTTGEGDDHRGRVPGGGFFCGDRLLGRVDEFEKD